MPTSDNLVASLMPPTHRGIGKIPVGGPMWPTHGAPMGPHGAPIGPHGPHGALGAAWAPSSPVVVRRNFEKLTKIDIFPFLGSKMGQKVEIEGVGPP